MNTTAIDNTRLPRHIAIIMDGNGRWAKARGMERSMGHQEGVAAVRDITTACARMGISYLTLYTFSTENWNRPQAEVAALMGLILTSLEEELFMENNVRLRVIGDLMRVPENVRESIDGLIRRTAANTGLTMVIALSYSSRWEITETVKILMRKAADGSLSPETLTETDFGKTLTTSFMPDPELLIRTGGEQRLSNYLLWQCAYSELYFTPTLWPDFREEDLRRAIADYQGRERRFGMTSEQVSAQTSN